MPLKIDGDKIKKTLIFDKDDYERIVKFAEMNKAADNKELNSISKILRAAIKAYINPDKEITEMNILKKYTQRELFGYFSYNEALLLINAFNGLLYDINSSIPPHTLLYGQVEDSINLDNTDSFFNVDKIKLLDKINKLTEFQAYIVIKMCFEFWGLPNEKRQGENMGKTIREIFLVVGEQNAD